MSFPFCLKLKGCPLCVGLRTDTKDKTHPKYALILTCHSLSESLELQQSISLLEFDPSPPSSFAQALLAQRKLSFT